MTRSRTVSLKLETEDEIKAEHLEVGISLNRTIRERFVSRCANKLANLQINYQVNLPIKKIAGIRV